MATAHTKKTSLTLPCLVTLWEYWNDPTQIGTLKSRVPSNSTPSSLGMVSTSICDSSLSTLDTMVDSKHVRLPLLGTAVYWVIERTNSTEHTKPEQRWQMQRKVGIILCATCRFLYIRFDDDIEVH